MRPRISITEYVRPSVRWSVRPSVGRSVRHAFVNIKENQRFRVKYCNDVIIQIIWHREDASLVLWALFRTNTMYHQPNYMMWPQDNANWSSFHADHKRMNTRLSEND